jgi:hypothetical protein
MIIGALSQLRVEQGYRHGDDPVSLIVLQAPSSWKRSSSHLGRWPLDVGQRRLCGRLVYALAEHAWRCFGWSSWRAHRVDTFAPFVSACQPPYDRRSSTICQHVSAPMIADPTPFVQHYDRRSSTIVSTCQHPL